MCACINYSQGMNFDGMPAEKLSAWLTMITLTHLIMWPIFVFCFLQINWQRVQDEKFQKKFGAFTMGLNLKNGRWVILHVVWFFYRRLLLAMIVCLQRHLWIEVQVFVWLVVFEVQYVEIIQPYEDKYDQLIHIGNEVIICLVYYTILL